MMIEKNEIVNTFIDHAMAVSDDFNAYAKVGGGDATMTWDEVDIPITKCIELIYSVKGEDELSLSPDEVKTLSFKLDEENTNEAFKIFYGGTK